jgi:hypothetical protein
MSRVRTASKIDANQPDIVDLFRRLGWSVLLIHQIKNACDIMVARDGITIAVEIKDGTKPPSARKLTEGERTFKEGWNGHWALVESTDDVINLHMQTMHSGKPPKYAIPYGCAPTD